MKESKMTVAFSLPGVIIGVEDNRVTVEFPAISSRLLSPEGVKALTDGMNDLDSDILLERVNHYAITESLRARIGLSCITQHSITSQTPEPIKSAPISRREIMG